ncbi:hypothetical protein ABCR94_16445 [Streptomyces sp. 21So2-11]
MAHLRENPPGGHEVLDEDAARPEGAPRRLRDPDIAQEDERD